MQRTIINCQTGQVIIEELSPEEESDRLKEIEAVQVVETEKRKVDAKRQLAKTLAELGVMTVNRGIFTDEDIADKQIEADEIIERLQSDLLPM